MRKKPTLADDESYPEILGQHFYVRLSEPVLQLGAYRVTRGSLWRDLHASGVHAARRFQATCQELQVKSVKELFATPPQAFAERIGCGLHTLNVAIRILTAHGYSINDWYFRTGQQATFSTLKDHVRKNREEVTPTPKVISLVPTEKELRYAKRKRPRHAA